MRKFILSFFLSLLLATQAFAALVVNPITGKLDKTGVSPVGLGSSQSLITVKETNVFDTVYNFNGVSTYTNNTTEAKSTFGTAFTAMFDNTQILYLGKSSTFSGLSVLLKAYTTQTTLTLNATYWNGSSWAALSKTDNTSQFQKSGTMTWSIPGDWAQTSVNGTTNYWIALAFTSTPSTAPTIYNIKPNSNPTFAVLDSNGDTTQQALTVKKGQILTNGAAVSQPQTFVIGLASSRNGHNADFVCAGAKDQICINAAITACGSSPCNLVLLEGTYNLTSSIGISGGTGVALINNLTISGQGPGKTILKTSNGTYATIQDTTNPTTGSPLTNLTVRDLEMDRSADTKDSNVSRKGIFIKYLRNMRVQNVYIHDSGATCIGTDFINGGFISDNWLVNCGTSSATTGSSGVGIGTGEYTTEPMVISNNVITGSGYAGVLLETQGGATAGESNNYVVSGNVITGGSQYGIVIDGTSNIVVSGNIIRSNTKDGVLIKNNTIPNNIMISGNNINDNTLYGINITSTGALKVNINNNDLTGNGSGTVSSSMTSVFDLNRFNNIGDIIPAETIAGAAVITANACGGVKMINSSGNVTTNTTNTFTAPSATFPGCCMDVINIDSADTITLDNNANFKSAGAADVVLGPADSVRVCNNGTVWYQVAATGNN